MGVCDHLKTSWQLLPPQKKKITTKNRLTLWLRKVKPDDFCGLCNLLLFCVCSSNSCFSNLFLSSSEHSWRETLSCNLERDHEAVAMTVESAAGKAARCQETQLERLERTGSREGGQNSRRMARHHHLMSAKHFCFSFFFFFSTEQKGRLEIRVSTWLDSGESCSKLPNWYTRLYVFQM